MMPRDQRRIELEGLESVDPALLVIRYYELTDAANAWPSALRQPPPAEMIEAILEREEALFHCTPSQPIPVPPCDTSPSCSSH